MMLEPMAIHLPKTESNSSWKELKILFRERIRCG